MSHAHKYPINPELLLKTRFGSDYQSIRGQIPHHAILSFFPNSSSHIDKDYPPSKTIPWLTDLVKLTLFTHKNLSICLATLPLGAPLSTMILEELIHCGVHTFISIGFAGSISSDFEPHDILIPTDSLMEDGVSRLYLPSNEKSYPSQTLIHSIESAGHLLNLLSHRASCWSISTPYREELSHIRNLEQDGIRCVDMECAALFAVASCLGVNLASVFSVSDTLTEEIWSPHYSDKKASRRKKQLLNVATEALYLYSLAETKSS